MMTNGKTPTSITGRVQNGVVVLDNPASLPEGQSVRVEPIGVVSREQSDAERAELLLKMKALFAEWNEEDSKLTDEEASYLTIALEESRQRYRTPSAD